MSIDLWAPHNKLKIECGAQGQDGHKKPQQGPLHQTVIPDFYLLELPLVSGPRNAAVVYIFLLDSYSWPNSKYNGRNNGWAQERNQEMEDAMS